MIEHGACPALLTAGACSTLLTASHARACVCACVVTDPLSKGLAEFQSATCNEPPHALPGRAQTEGLSRTQRRALQHSQAAPSSVRGQTRAAAGQEVKVTRLVYLSAGSKTRDPCGWRLRGNRKKGIAQVLELQLLDTHSAGFAVLSQHVRAQQLLACSVRLSWVANNGTETLCQVLAHGASERWGVHHQPSAGSIKLAEATKHPNTP